MSAPWLACCNVYLFCSGVTCLCLICPCYVACCNMFLLSISRYANILKVFLYMLCSLLCHSPTWLQLCSFLFIAEFVVALVILVICGWFLVFIFYFYSFGALWLNLVTEFVKFILLVFIRKFGCKNGWEIPYFMEFVVLIL